MVETVNVKIGGAAGSAKTVKVTPVAGLTPFEALVRGNARGERIADHAFFNKMLRGKDKRENFVRLPGGLSTRSGWFEGEYLVVGGKGKPVGKGVETQHVYKGHVITLLYQTPPEYRDAIDTVLACTHGFLPDGTPTIQILDNKGNPVLGMDDATERMSVKLNGQIYTVKVKRRGLGTDWDAEGDEKTYITLGYRADHGLLGHGYTNGEEFHLIYSLFSSFYRSGLYIARDQDATKDSGKVSGSEEKKS
ncbi:Uncharacterised protein [Candidatus Gugararchaeum adminiculabundum]|nr:Uncharacterised protein [Candidatus Gugararchaeum adminiculabundum]